MILLSYLYFFAGLLVLAILFRISCCQYWRRSTCCSLNLIPRVSLRTVLGTRLHLATSATCWSPASKLTLSCYLKWSCFSRWILGYFIALICYLICQFSAFVVSMHHWWDGYLHNRDIWSSSLFLCIRWVDGTVEAIPSAQWIQRKREFY